MKKIFAFMKMALAATVALTVFSCSVDENKDEVATKDCGSLKLSIAIPKFMVPDTDASARMVMPSTKVIKFFIYKNADSDEVIYSKELSVSNSGLEYKDFSIVTAQLDDVPAGNYPKRTMKIELYDSQENLLTHALNEKKDAIDEESDGRVTVEAGKTGADSETVEFYALPGNPTTVGGIGTDEETGEVYENEFEVNDDGEAENRVCNLYLGTDEETVANYDIYYEAYKVIIPSGYGLDVTLRAKNESKKEVAIVVYTEYGAASDEDIVVSTDETFNEKKFASIPMSYGETRYIVLYTKGPLTGLNANSDPELLLTLTEDED